MLANIIRQVKALPRFRVIAIASTVVFLFSLWLPWRSTAHIEDGYYAGTGGAPIPGWEAGGTWPGLFAIAFLVFELLRALGRLTKYAPRHDLITITASAVLAVSGVVLYAQAMLIVLHPLGTYFFDVAIGSFFTFAAACGLAAGAVLAARTPTIRATLNAITQRIRTELHDARNELRRDVG